VRQVLSLVQPARNWASSGWATWAEVLLHTSCPNHLPDLKMNPFPLQLTPAGMALNLSRKGFALLIYDACLPRVEEAFPPSQVAAGGLRQLAQECDRIIFCLPDYTILQRVLFGSSSASSSSSSADEGDRGLVAFLKPGMCDRRTPCIDIRCTHGTHGTHGTRAHRTHMGGCRTCVGGLRYFASGVDAGDGATSARNGHHLPRRPGVGHGGQGRGRHPVHHGERSAPTLARATRTTALTSLTAHARTTAHAHNRRLVATEARSRQLSRPCGPWARK
jgi:hypothetical protein